jgi:hypothetical protein
MISVWPTRKIKKILSRRVYVDSAGNLFEGTHREALLHYQHLHPTESIQLNLLPKKRKANG